MMLLHTRDDSFQRLDQNLQTKAVAAKLNNL